MFTKMEKIWRKPTIKNENQIYFIPARRPIGRPIAAPITVFPKAPIFFFSVEGLSDFGLAFDGCWETVLAVAFELCC